ncbi:MAG: hypothetical protein K2V38_00660 [Gemmataceae bacterium]|nr:hypothetical protein [Gemmataceae bacterium]
MTVHSAEATEQAVAEMLATSVPSWLHGRIVVEEAKGWVREHLERYAEEKARFPDEPLLPWTNWLGYDGEWEDAFFVVLVLHVDAFELFCGTGYWPDVRDFGEGELDDIPPADWHRAWAARFNVPRPPLLLGREAVREWVGCDW